jgi:PAS domain S-box-containing protein
VRTVLPLLALAAAYYVGARVGLLLALVEGQVTPLWPPTGIALVGLLLLGVRVWPAIALAALLVNAPLGPSLLGAVMIAVGNTAAPLAAYALLRRVSFRAALDRLRDALALVFLGAFAGMLVSATVGSGVLVLSGAVDSAEFWSTWAVWWAGDAMGVLVVAPFLLVLRSARALRTVPAPRLAEGLLLILGTLLAAVFVLNRDDQMIYAVFPFLIWGAVRFGLAGAAPSALVVVIVAALAAVRGSGLLADEPLFERMAVLHAFNGTAALTAFLLAALTTERNRAREAAEHAGSSLEQRVQERTAQLVAAVDQVQRSEAMLAEAQRVGQVGSWDWDPESDAVAWTDEHFRLFGLEPGSISMDYTAFLDRVHADDRDVVERAVDRAFRDHSPFTVQYRVVWPDGNVHWLEGHGSVVLDRGGRVLKVVGTARDVTEAKLADDALRRSEEKFRTLLASAKFSPVGMQIDVEMTVASHTVDIAVTDRGTGIPIQRQPLPFGRFERLDSPVKGVGLGLYISRGIARAHGGDLVLGRSGPEGSTFVLSLPHLDVRSAHPA